MERSILRDDREKGILQDDREKGIFRGNGKIGIERIKSESKNANNLCTGSPIWYN